MGEQKQSETDAAEILRAEAKRLEGLTYAGDRGPSFEFLNALRSGADALEGRHKLNYAKHSELLARELRVTHGKLNTVLNQVDGIREILLTAKFCIESDKPDDKKLFMAKGYIAAALEAMAPFSLRD